MRDILEGGGNPKHWSSSFHWLLQTLWLTKIHVWTLLRIHLRHRLWKKAKRTSFSLEKVIFWPAFLKQNNFLLQPPPKPIGFTRKIIALVQFLKLFWGDRNISSCKSNCFSELGDDRNIILLQHCSTLFVLLKYIQKTLHLHYESSLSKGASEMVFQASPTGSLTQE